MTKLKIYVKQLNDNIFLRHGSVKFTGLFTNREDLNMKKLNGFIRL